MSKVTKTILGATALFWASTSAQATTILYNDFSNTTGLQINGSATTTTDVNNRDVLRLTSTTSQSGTAFSTNTVALDNDASFSTAFVFNISNPSGISDGDGQGADGIVFVVQTQSNNVGGSGGGIGYAGIGNSVGIEFDTWNNGGGDGHNGNHVGINLNGSLSSVVRGNVATRMNNGNDWYGWVDYNGFTDLLEVRIAQNNIRPGSAFLSHTVDLASTLGSLNAFVGFTSGTGGAGGAHDIVSWQFNSDFNPINQIGVPAPGALLLIGFGLIGLSAVRRKVS